MPSLVTASTDSTRSVRRLSINHGDIHQRQAAIAATDTEDYGASQVVARLSTSSSSSKSPTIPTRIRIRRMLLLFNLYRGFIARNFRIDDRFTIGKNAPDYLKLECNGSTISTLNVQSLFSMTEYYFGRFQQPDASPLSSVGPERETFLLFCDRMTLLARILDIEPGFDKDADYIAKGFIGIHSDSYSYLGVADSDELPTLLEEYPVGHTLCNVHLKPSHYLHHDSEYIDERIRNFVVNNTPRVERHGNDLAMHRAQLMAQRMAAITAPTVSQLNSSTITNMLSQLANMSTGTPSQQYNPRLLPSPSTLLDNNDHDPPAAIPYDTYDHGEVSTTVVPSQSTTTVVQSQSSTTVQPSAFTVPAVPQSMNVQPSTVTVPAVLPSMTVQPSTVTVPTVLPVATSQATVTGTQSSSVFQPIAQVVPSAFRSVSSPPTLPPTAPPVSAQTNYTTLTQHQLASLDPLSTNSRDAIE